MTKPYVEITVNILSSIAGDSVPIFKKSFERMVSHIPCFVI